LPRRTKAKLPVREGAIEERFAAAPIMHGWKYWKQSGLGRNSRPDRHLMGPSGENGHIEWKRPGEVPTEAQAMELDDLEYMGHRVACCDSTESASLFVAALTKKLPWVLMGWRQRWRHEHPLGKKLPATRCSPYLKAKITVSVKNLRG
jgi:hypothetical protein